MAFTNQRIRKRNPRYANDDDDDDGDRPLQRARGTFGMSDSNINNNNNLNDDEHDALIDHTSDDDKEKFPDYGSEGDRQGTQTTPLRSNTGATATTTQQVNTTPASITSPSSQPSVMPMSTNPIGISAAIYRLYPHGVPYSVGHEELKWQQAVKGNAAATKQFRAEALMQQGMVVFAFMQPDDTTLSLLHSPATYAARGAEGALKGKDIGFVGDRLPFSSPIPVILQKEKPWKWIQIEGDFDDIAIMGFYCNPQNVNLFYAPPPGKALTKQLLPRLILLPSNYVPFCADAPRTPGQLLSQIISDLATHPEANATTYELLMAWCMAAAHGIDGSSVLTYSLDAAYSNTFAYQNWIQLRLAATLGTTSTTTPAPNMPSATSAAQPTNLSALATVAAEFGKGVLAAITPAGGANVTGTLGIQQPAATTLGKSYDAYQYAVLQGFSNCPTPAGLQPIWGLFTQTKSVDTIRLHIKIAMKKWARRHAVNIHKGLLLPKTTIEAIRDLNFNPGGGVAYFNSAEKGISILTCQPMAGETRDSARATELAQEISNASRTLAEALDLGKNDPRSPPGTYQDLKATVGTFCALLHTIFGPGCDYYQKCFELYTCLDSDTVEENFIHFDPLYCRQIIWAILDDGREYFNNPMMPDSFLVPLGTHIEYPVSALEEFNRPIKNQTPIIKKNFPHQWQPRQDRQESRARTIATGSNGGGQSRAPVPNVISGAASTASTTRTGTSSMTGTPTTTTAIRQSNIHPKIKTIMGAYLTRVGRLQISRIMAAANVTWSDMPTLPGYMDGTTNKLCYNFVLGKCNPRYCNHRLGHAPDTEITNDFADEICTLLQPGILDMTPELARVSWPEFKATMSSRGRATE